MIAFLVKSTLSLAILYVFFQLVLARENIPVFKRYYLLGALAFSFVLPFVQINVSSPVVPVFNAYLFQQPNLQADKIEAAPLAEKNSFQTIWYLYILYSTVTLALLVRFILNIVNIAVLRKQCATATINGIRVVLTNQQSLPYSFWNCVYVNKLEFENNRIPNELLIHEFAHIRQKHSIDILMLEIIQTFCWFNPMIMLYKRAIRLNHEYLADNYVLTTNIALKDYQNQLLNVVFRNNSTYLASNFNYSLTKKRLIMMTKNKTKAISFKIAMVPVLTVALFYLFSCNKEMMPTTANPDSWWIPIAEKHNIKLHGYNGFPDMVEMGTTNSVDNGVARLENAVFIMKDGDEKYIIIKSPLAFHNLKTNLIEGKEGVIEYYSFSSKSTKPAQTIEMKDFQYQIEGSGHKWKAENSTLKVR